MLSPSHIIARALILARGLLLALIVLTGSVAPGTMLERQPAGGFTMVLCAGQGDVTITLDADGQPIERSHVVCDWSMLVLATLSRDTVLPEPEHFALPCAQPTLGLAIAVAKDVHRQNRPRAPPRIL